MYLEQSISPREQAAHRLTELLQAEAGIPVLLLVSGGSALSLLDLVPKAALSALLTLGVLDERFTTEPQQHNFLQLSQTAFYTQALAAGVRVLSTIVEPTDTKERLAERYTEMLQTRRQEHKDGKIIITMGMGDDGHTAGIFPSVPLHGSTWVASMSLPEGVNPHRERISVTPDFLITEVDAAVVYVTGVSKADMLQAVCTKTAAVPALVWHDMKEVTVFTDLTIQ